MFAAGGDGFAVAFGDPQDAVDAAVEVQRALAAEPWPAACSCGSRMGLETGTAHERRGHYLGPAPIRAARIMAAAHGGQVILGARTASLLDGIELVDLGVHRLTTCPGPSGSSRCGSTARRRISRPSAPGHAPREPADADCRPDRPRSPAARRRRPRSGAPAGDPDRGRRGRQDPVGVEVGASLADDAPTGCGWSSWRALTDAAAVPDAIATAMGITPQAATPVTHTVADALSGRRVLVVLDNCEHLLTRRPRPWTRSRRCATVRVLATSREALQVAGEQRRLVLPLALDGDSASPAVALFVERARARTAASTSTSRRPRQR